MLHYAWPEQIRRQAETAGMLAGHICPPTALCQAGATVFSAPILGFEIKRVRLSSLGLRTAVVSTIQNVDGQSTSMAYLAYWWVFEAGPRPETSVPTHILDFLQGLFKSGCATSTLWVFSAAIMVSHGGLDLW